MILVKMVKKLYKYMMGICNEFGNHFGVICRVEPNLGEFCCTVIISGVLIKFSLLIVLNTYLYGSN